MHKKILIIILSFFIFASLTAPVLAQEKNKLTGSVGSTCLYNDSVLTMNCIMPLFANAVYWLFIMSGVVAVFLIAYGGIKYLTSSGEAKAVESARKTITWAIIGLITILLSFMIVNIIADLTKVNCITEFGFTACRSSDDDLSSCSDVGGVCANVFDGNPNNCPSGSGLSGTCSDRSQVCCAPSETILTCIEAGGECRSVFDGDPNNCPSGSGRSGSCSDRSQVCCAP